MCGLCGMFESGRRWLDAAATLDPAQVRRERLRRVQIVRRVLGPARIAVDDWEGASFVLRGPTGRTEIVDNLFDLWRVAEKLGRRRLDPLDTVASATFLAGDGGRAPAGTSPVSATGTPLPENLGGATKDRIPLHVLTGFLGSGKTTLLNRMLRDPALADSAVLINEIGAISIDHHLVESMESTNALDIVVLKGGCACCAVRGDLVAALHELYARRVSGALPPFRRVVMETTGLADPAPVLFTLAGDPALRHKFHADGVIATVDAVHAAGQLRHHPESRKQVAAADHLVITKADLVEVEAAAALAAALRRLNPAASVAAAGETMDLAALLAGRRGTIALDALARSADAAKYPLGDHAVHAEHTPGVASVSFELDASVEWTAFAVWLTLLLHAHGDRLLRFKALLRVAGWPAPVALDAIHHLIHPPLHLGTRAELADKSQLVFIAEAVPMERIEPSLRAFLAAARPRHVAERARAPAPDAA